MSRDARGSRGAASGTAWALAWAWAWATPKRNREGRTRDSPTAMPIEQEARFGFETLDVHQRAVDFVARAGDIAAHLPPGQAALADQLRRAAMSVVLNIAEGSGRLRDADAARHRAIARGSAMECAAVLDICRVVGFAGPTELAEARRLLLRVVQMLSKMCR